MCTRCAGLRLCIMASLLQAFDDARSSTPARKISHTKGLDGAKRAAQRPIYGAQGGVVARAEGAFRTCKGAHSTALARDLCASIAYYVYN